MRKSWLKNKDRKTKQKVRESLGGLKERDRENDPVKAGVRAKSGETTTESQPWEGKETWTPS